MFVYRATLERGEKKIVALRHLPAVSLASSASTTTARHCASHNRRNSFEHGYSIAREILYKEVKWPHSIIR